MADYFYPPQITLSPTDGPVAASVRLPGSKSITNRALLLAALADGESRLLAPLHSEDTFYMASALRELGVSVEETPEQDFIVTGRGGWFDAPNKPLFVGNSGTTVRFLTAAACLAPAGADVVLDGVARMRERPIRDLVGALLGGGGGGGGALFWLPGAGAPGGGGGGGGPAGWALPPARGCQLAVFDGAAPGRAVCRAGG